MLMTAFLLGTAAQAQITTSAISGTVKSATDEALVGATVVATHNPSGTKYITTTRPGGVFSIQNMRVGGPYTIEITFVGYKTQKLEDVYLQLAETSQLPAQLVKNEATMETVVVTGTSRRNNILNANRAGAVTNVGRREITVLPSISRSINDLSRLTPQSNGSAVAGGNSRQNNITVDGSDFNNTFGIGANVPAQGSPISLDAVEEISVNITPFDVRQSGFIGSALNAVTRSGTNTVSGSIYTYWRNEKMQGDQVEKTKFTRQPLQYNLYGARVGGPIIKNKLFYFLSFESEKTISPGQSKIAATAAAPFGSGPNVARPTATELNDISAFLLSKYGYNTGAYQGYDLEATKNRILARLDWNISPKNKVSLRYNQVESKDPAFLSTSFGSTGVSAPAFGSGRSEASALNSLHFQNSNYFQDYNFYSIAAELNSTFNSRISNTLRASYNNQNEPRSSNSSVFPFVDIYKDGSPFTSFGYEPFTFGNLRDVKIYSFVDNLTAQFGRHNFLLGVQADFTKTINGFQPLGASYYRFNSWADFVNGVKPADFAYTYSLKKDYSQAFPGFKFAQYSAFFQDEFTINKRFKLTYGIRADLSAYPGVEEVKENPLVSALTFQKGIKVNTGKLPDQKILFSPRVGFNWDLYGDRSLQIRGGTGIFTGRVPYVWIVGQAGNSGMLQITQSFNGTANTPGVFSADIGTYRPATPPVPGTTMPSTVTAFADNFKMPQTWKTSLAIDVKLPLGIIGTLEAIYNRDYNVIYSKNINLADPAPLNVNGYPDNRMIYPNANAQKYINKLTSGGPGILVPSATGTTAFSMILTGNEKRGHYASITTRFERPFRKGFSAMVSYTKSFGNRLYDGQGDQPFNTWSLVNSVNGANYPNLSHALDVVPDRVIAAVTYRKEYLKHLATSISFFYEGAIGGRFTYLYSADFNRDGTSADPIYIPRNASEITFQTQVVNGVTYTPQMQSDLFFAYVEQDKYLRTHKGQYAERNGAQLPWRNQVDVKLLQDLFVNIGKSKNTLQFSLDIFNFGNLINPAWGKLKTVNNAAILVPRNQASLVPGGTVKPEFNLALDRGQIITRTFRDNVTISSTYYMQMGLRYLFN